MPTKKRQPIVLNTGYLQVGTVAALVVPLVVLVLYFGSVNSSLNELKQTAADHGALLKSSQADVQELKEGQHDQAVSLYYIKRKLNLPAGPGNAVERASDVEIDAKVMAAPTESSK
jgi:hypothetical protein